MNCVWAYQECSCPQGHKSWKPEKKSSYILLYSTKPVTVHRELPSSANSVDKQKGNTNSLILDGIYHDRDYVCSPRSTWRCMSFWSNVTFFIYCTKSINCLWVNLQVLDTRLKEREKVLRVFFVFSFKVKYIKYIGLLFTWNAINEWTLQRL